MRPTLRPYQEDAVSAVLKSLEGNPSTLLVMATGLGKTQVGCSVAEHFLPGKVLWLAHRKELVTQGAERLQLVTGEQVEIEMAEMWASNRARIVSASLDSIRTRLERWPPDHFSFLVFDECFPAGTLVDGRPIESLQLGDEVSSVDHSDGVVHPRPVVRIFKKRCSSMWRLSYGASTLTCTGNHPVFVKGRGYVEAKNLKSGDVLCLRNSVHTRPCDLSAGQEDLLPSVSRESLIGDYGAHEPHPRFGSHEDQQPDASRGQQGASHGDPESHGAQATGSDGQRYRADSRREGYLRSPGLAHECGRANQDASWERLPQLLQTRCWEPGAEDRNRGGRAQPPSASQKSPGPQEGGLLTWIRLDCVENIEPSSPGGDWVYNLEVEGSHTYFANDVLVHNCHHAVAKSYKKVWEHFTCKKLGMTATPDRGDEKALGQLTSDVAGVWDIQDGIEGGYLVPIRGRTVTVEEVDLSHISKSAGDLAIGELDEEMAKHIEGIVQKTLELEPGRQGIWFFPGVKSAELACDRINALGHACAFVCGETPKEDRDDIMRGFKAGRYSHLTNCQVATEGFDAPNADMVVIGRPTLSRALYAQMVGRGLRVLPGTVEGVADALSRRDRVASSAKPYCAVIDYAGNSGKHTLVTPEDLLGGDYSEEEVKLAKKAAKDGVAGDVLEGLEAARRELKAMMAKLQSKVKAQVQTFNPFEVLNIKATDTQRLAKYSQPATDGQIKALEKFGVKPEDLKDASKLVASKMLSSCIERSRLGLASYKQLKVLKKYGFEKVNVSFKTASKMIDFIARSNWNPDRTKLMEMAG